MQASDYISTFLATLQSQKKTVGTLDYYKRYLCRFFELSRLDIADLEDYSKVEDAYLLICKTPNAHTMCELSPNTLKKYLITMSPFCDWLVRRGVIRANHFATLKKPKIPKIIKKPHLKKEEIISIYRAVNDRWSGYLRQRNEMIISLVLETGLRLSEICSLKFSDIEFLDEGARIYVRGKGEKERYVLASRMFALSLRFWKLQSHVSSDYVFPSTRGEGAFTPYGLSNMFKQIKKRVCTRVYCHLFRHTYASTKLRFGVSLETIRHNMGHSSLVTTSGYITHDDEEHLAEMNKISFRCIQC